jgi:hypothetical protein
VLLNFLARVREWSWRVRTGSQHEPTAATARYGRIQRPYLWTVRLSFLAFLSAVFLLLAGVLVVS